MTAHPGMTDDERVTLEAEVENLERRADHIRARIESARHAVVLERLAGTDWEWDGDTLALMKSESSKVLRETLCSLPHVWPHGGLTLVIGGKEVYISCDDGDISMRPEYDTVVREHATLNKGDTMDRTQSDLLFFTLCARVVLHIAAAAGMTLIPERILAAEVIGLRAKADRLEEKDRRIRAALAPS